MFGSSLCPAVGDSRVPERLTGPGIVLPYAGRRGCGVRAPDSRVVLTARHLRAGTQDTAAAGAPVRGCSAPLPARLLPGPPGRRWSAGFACAGCAWGDGARGAGGVAPRGVHAGGGAVELFAERGANGGRRAEGAVRSGAPCGARRGAVRPGGGCLGCVGGVGERGARGGAVRGVHAGGGETRLFAVRGMPGGGCTQRAGAGGRLCAGRGACTRGGREGEVSAGRGAGGLGGACSPPGASRGAGKKSPVGLRFRGGETKATTNDK